MAGDVDVVTEGPILLAEHEEVLDVRGERAQLGVRRVARHVPQNQGRESGDSRRKAE